MYSNLVKLYRTFVQPLEKIADQNLPGYQPINFADYVNFF